MSELDWHKKKLNNKKKLSRKWLHETIKLTVQYLLENSFGDGSIGPENKYQWAIAAVEFL